mmetsp:Transcript_35468/g.113475  ORF Transcript_35468/g.113475 Transcript_35468/m.113475 type:complete len:429 (+) Transcript_35468:2289-3575(+)
MRAPAVMRSSAKCHRKRATSLVYEARRCSLSSKSFRVVESSSAVFILPPPSPPPRLSRNRIARSGVIRFIWSSKPSRSSGARALPLRSVAPCWSLSLSWSSRSMSLMSGSCDEQPSPPAISDVERQASLSSRKPLLTRFWLRVRSCLEWASPIVRSARLWRKCCVTSASRYAYTASCELSSGTATTSSLRGGKSSSAAPLPSTRCPLFEWRIMSARRSTRRASSALSSCCLYGLPMLCSQKPSSWLAPNGVIRRNASSPLRSSMELLSGVPLTIHLRGACSASHDTASSEVACATSCISSSTTRAHATAASSGLLWSSCWYVVSTTSCLASSAAFAVSARSSSSLSTDSESVAFASSTSHCESSAGGTMISVARDAALPAAASRGRLGSDATTSDATSSVLPSPISSQSSPPHIRGGASSRSSASAGE